MVLDKQREPVDSDSTADQEVIFIEEGAGDHERFIGCAARIN